MDPISPIRSHDQAAGFTLVETLVAITILMIAITGPLVIANQSLTTALSARDQSIASYLAQEEMEIVKNIKDNNNVQPQTTDDPDISNWVNDIGLEPCTGSHRCDASISSLVGEGTISMPPHVTLEDCGAYLNSRCPLVLSNTGYLEQSLDHSDPPTPFSRSFYLTQVGSNPTEYQVTVVVSWNEGTVADEVSVTSELTNGTR